MIGMVIHALRRWLTPPDGEEPTDATAASGLQCLHLVSYVVERPSLQGGLTDAGIIDLVATALTVHGPRYVWGWTDREATQYRSQSQPSVYLR